MTNIDEVVILAGGKGTRLTEETALIPKPMVTIGGIPIIEHIMNIYVKFKINNFIICLGYKGEVIKNYFSNYQNNNSDIEINFKNNSITYLKKKKIEWKIKLINTGKLTGTAGRLKLIRDFIKNENFFFTYGDGLADINLDLLRKNHIKSKKILTLTSIQNSSRFGIIVKKKNKFLFTEKPLFKESRINGGFGISNKKIFKYISSNKEMLESGPFEKISKDGQLNSYEHNGFWKSMDTLRDKIELEEIYKKNKKKW